MRVRFKVNVNLKEGKKAKRYNKGEAIDLDDKLAQKYIDSGLAYGIEGNDPYTIKRASVEGWMTKYGVPPGDRR